MENRRWMNGKRFTLILCGLMTWFFVMPATAADTDQPAPGWVKLKLETVKLTKDSADKLVASGDPVRVGVYLMMAPAWASTIGNSNKQVHISQSRMSFAVFNTKNCNPGDYLSASPANYFLICAENNMDDPMPSWGCDDLPMAGLGEWYSSSVGWYQFTWPNYSYGAGFQGGMVYNSGAAYYKTVNDTIYIKLFDLQFKLKSSNRDLPMDFVDNIDKLDGSSGNTELNIVNRATYNYRPAGITAADWTAQSIIDAGYFSFISGGIFIETGPVVETFEPNSAS